MADPVLNGPFDNLGEALRAAADQHGEVEAFVDGEQRLTYAAWLRNAAGLATVLQQRGVGRGDVVCLMLPSSVDYAISYVAVQLLGAVVTGINTRLGPVEVEAILKRCEPVLVIGSGSAGLRVPEGYSGRLVGQDELAELYAAAPLDRFADVGPVSPAVIVWTSGTTGLPKGAWFDYAGLAGGARVSGVLSAPFDRRIMPSPMAHAAFMTRVWDQIVYVITTVLSPTPWNAAEYLEIMLSERITVGQGVPTQWEKLLELSQFATADLSNLRIAGTGAARVPRELVRAMRERLSCPVVVRYAATETPTISGTREDDPIDVLERTVGRGLNGIGVRILDEYNTPLPVGEVGRVAIGSPFCMRGYWLDEAATTAAFTEDGWYISSDLGSIDADGNLLLAGRASDVYIRGGYNIYPLEVENVLSAYPGVRSAAVVGAVAPVLGEIGVAFVVLLADASVTVDDLRSWCREQIADYKAPDRIEFVDELPLTSMMKIDKTRLSRLAAAAGS